MSWSFGFVTDGTLSTFDDALADAKAAYSAEQAGYNQTVTEETQSQINAAGDAARTIIKTHSVGSTDKSYNVNFSGHSNPGHEPSPGMGTDYIQVSITQVP